MISKIRNILVSLARNPVFLFVPFSVLYGIWLLGGESIKILENIFVIGNKIIFLIIAAGVLVRATERRTVLIWVSIFCLFAWSGAYLEYPSDPWEHVRRIFQWQNLFYAHEHSERFKMSYFWHWSVASAFPFLSHRIILDLISAFWQTMVGYYFFRFCWHIGFSARLSYLQVLAFFLLCGTSIFNIRYYALSSTPFALCAYFEMLTVLSGLGRVAPKRIIIKLLLLSLLVALNHRQGFLFFLVAGLPIAIWKTFGKTILLNSRQILQRSLKIVQLGVLISLILSIVSWLSSGEKFGTGFVHPLGFVKLWRDEIRYFSTVGLSGILSLILAIKDFRRWPLTAFLTLAPTLFLLFPWVGIILFFLFQINSDSISVTYRVLLAVPVTLFLVQWIYDYFETRGYRPGLGTALVIIGLSIIPYSPTYGKLLFQFIEPGGKRQATHVDELVSVVKDLGWSQDICPIVTDAETGFVLGSFLGASDIPSRLLPNLVAYSRDNRVGTDVSESKNPCIYIIYKGREEDPPSIIAKLSSHWDSALGSPAVQAKVMQNQEARIQSLTSKAIETANYRLYLTKAFSQR